MALSELLNIAKYSSGYHGDGPAAATPDFGFLFNGQQQTDKRQATALKLLQLKALVQKATADAAIEKRKQDLWNSVGSPTVSDKSTAGDVSSIVDSEKVGGRDAGVVNDGEVAGNADPQTTAQIPGDTQSNSSLVNMMKSLQPTISPEGNMILSRPKIKKPIYPGAAKRYDEARTFDYAKRLADQTIIQSGKRRKDITPDDYKTLVNDQIPKAETYLYGRPLSQPEDKKVVDASADPTGVTKAVQAAMDLGRADAPAPGASGSAPQVQSYNEGQTANNPKTGKRLIFKGGKWEPLN